MGTSNTSEHTTHHTWLEEHMADTLKCRLARFSALNPDGLVALTLTNLPPASTGASLSCQWRRRSSHIVSSYSATKCTVFDDDDAAIRDASPKMPLMLVSVPHWHRMPQNAEGDSSQNVTTVVSPLAESRFALRPSSVNDS